jgi:hypothetical protein
MTETESHEKDDPPAIGSHMTAKDGTDEMKAASTVNQDASAPELDDFGLPIKAVRRAERKDPSDEADGDGDTFHDVEEGSKNPIKEKEEDTANEKQKSHLNGSEEHRDVVKPQSGPPALGEPLSPTKSRLDAPVSRIKDEYEERPNAKRRESDKITSPIRKPARKSPQGVSEWSHQRLASKDESGGEDGEEVDWQDMPALGEYDLYDDDGKLVAKGVPQEDAEEAAYGGLGGAAKGYTRVQVDDDAQSATSMDDDTRYLFKDQGTNVMDEDDEQRDVLSQLQATKDLLNESQRIAYVGVTRLAMFQMVKELDQIEPTKNSKKELKSSVEDMKKWGQLMMVRLYSHMDINSDG